MNKLASAANEGIDPATYFPWHANALACVLSHFLVIEYEIKKKCYAWNKFAGIILTK